MPPLNTTYWTNLSWNVWLLFLHQNSNILILLTTIFGSKYKFSCVSHSHSPILPFSNLEFVCVQSLTMLMSGGSKSIEGASFSHFNDGLFVYCTCKQKVVIWTSKRLTIQGGCSTHAHCQRFGNFCLNVIQYLLCLNIFYSKYLAFL